VVGGHGSHLIGDLAKSNCLIVVPESTTRVEAGSPVDVLVFDREF
jgi:molybdopterin molybdotransferase